MVNLKSWDRLKQRQPIYQQYLKRELVEYRDWLKTNLHKEQKEALDKTFKKLREGLLNHCIINNIDVTTTLLEDIELLIQNS